MSNTTMNATASSITMYTTPRLDSLGLVVSLVMFYVMVATCAIVSNITILIAICRRLVPRNTVNVFFSSLAASDILMVVLSLLDCYAYLDGGWLFGEVTCKIQSLLIEVSFSASTLTLVAVSCERYLLMCQPHLKKRTLQNIYHLIGFVWFLSFIITSPLLHGYIVYENIDEEAKTREFVCGNKGWSTRYRLIYYSTYSFVVYMIPLLMMAFTHWRIALLVRTNDKRQAFSQKGLCLTMTVQEESSGSSELTDESIDSKHKSSFRKACCGSIRQFNPKKQTIHYGDRDHKRNERRIRAVRMLLVVTVTFFFLWTPFIIMRVVVLSGHRISQYLYKFSEVLILSSTAVNGFIYAYMSPPFRRAFKAILCCQNQKDIKGKYTAATMSNSGGV